MRRPLPVITVWLALTAAACSSPKPAAPAATVPAASNTPTAEDVPAPVDPPPAAPVLAPAERKPRTALQEEYHALALKNLCPEGFPLLQGSWRFIGESKVADYRDELTIAATRFREDLTGRAEDGTTETGHLEGEMRCLFSNRLLVMVDKVVPEGAFGNRSGDSYPCDILGDLSGRGEKMLIICYFDWDLRTAAGLEFEYERVK
jgi:hypothetical protein